MQITLRYDRRKGGGMPRYLVVAIRGLVGAAINSAVTTTAAVMVSPAQEPLNWGSIAKQAGAAAIVGAVLWLKQHPLPEQPE